MTLPPAIPLEFPETDDTDWSVGVQIALPLYEGGARSAQVQRQIVEVKKQQLRRQDTAQKIEQRIRSTLHAAGASYPGILLSRESAQAAEKNLELVADAYAKGSVTVMTLLDAQNAAMVARLMAANANYTFVKDMLSAQRAVGMQHYFLDGPTKDRWFAKLEAFTRKNPIQGVR